MAEWYSSLTVLGKAYFYVSIAATVFLIIQIIMLVVSFGGGDIDGDGIPDTDADAPDAGLTLFSVKSVTAFFAIGGWAGLAMLTSLPELIAVDVIVSVAAGFLSMLAVALIMRALVKMQCSGNIVIEKLVGQTATVYVKINPHRGSTGKINLTAQGRFMEIDAVTDGEEPLAYNDGVRIIRMENDLAVVEKIKEKE